MISKSFKFSRKVHPWSFVVVVASLIPALLFLMLTTVNVLEFLGLNGDIYNLFIVVFFFGAFISIVFFLLIINIELEFDKNRAIFRKRFRLLNNVLMKQEWTGEGVYLGNRTSVSYHSSRGGVKKVTILSVHDGSTMHVVVNHWECGLFGIKKRKLEDKLS
jgi:uncharacterized protein (DUF58 family)